MKKAVKDGWHKVWNCYVYVEDGRVKRGNFGGQIAYPYRKCKYGGWDLDTYMTLDALRAALSRDTVIFR